MPEFEYCFPLSASSSPLPSSLFSSLFSSLPRSSSPFPFLDSPSFFSLIYLWSIYYTVIKRIFGCWRDVSLVKNTYSSCRGPKCRGPHHVEWFTVDQIPSSGLCGHLLAHGSHKLTRAHTHTHLSQKLFLSVFTFRWY